MIAFFFKVSEMKGLKKLFYLCMRKVEVKPDPVQLNSVTHAVEFCRLPSTHLHLESRLCLREKKKKKSPPYV